MDNRASRLDGESSRGRIALNLSPGELAVFFTSRLNQDRSELSGKTMLDLGDVYETAEIRLNGKIAGVKIAPPYRFSLGVAQEPMGLLGPVSLSSFG